MPALTQCGYMAFSAAVSNILFTTVVVIPLLLALIFLLGG